ncbi:MAG: hypothetical protein K1X67_22990 [Fimbriimonadaceae bacterium]|nr:hypothetical protein [Fimbriimonadaceae bacterium]
MKLRVESPGDPALLAILQRHPNVELCPSPRTAGNLSATGLSRKDSASTDGGLASCRQDASGTFRSRQDASGTLVFHQGDWRREVRVADPTCEVRGLVELMDNNPMVCADVVSVPSPGATLALIALGPLAKAGLLLEPPTLLANTPLDEQDIANYLATEGWEAGAVGSAQAEDLDGILAMTAIAAVRLPPNPEDLAGIYDECFGRSFFVHHDAASIWHVNLVKGTPNAVYRLSLNREDSVGLLTIKVMADADGKCGAAQVVHAMNVMAGLEESLGLGL